MTVPIQGTIFIVSGQQLMAGERDPTQVGEALGSQNRRCTYLQLNVELKAV